MRREPVGGVQLQGKGVLTADPRKRPSQRARSAANLVLLMRLRRTLTGFIPSTAFAGKPWDTIGTLDNATHHESTWFPTIAEGEIPFKIITRWPGIHIV